MRKWNTKSLTNMDEFAYAKNEEDLKSKRNHMREE